jgi:hypothetical protein
VAFEQRRYELGAALRSLGLVRLRVPTRLVRERANARNLPDHLSPDFFVFSGPP